MTTEMREVTVGAVVFSIFVGVLVALYGGEETASGVGEGVRVTASFNRVDGLVEGDPVFLSGVRIGTVEKMYLDENFRARVTFWVDDSIMIPNDSSAAIHTDGLFGSKFIVLEPGAEEVALKSGDIITFTQDAVIVSDLLDLIIAEGKANQAR